ncbi:MAG TPA: hypothetical protein DCZ72_10285 [Armatimonadetes bacterium]|nr:hypothetical protein [Armatimonadota bacterium]
MKASEVHLLTFLKRPVQFVIPIYQREYSWDEGQCRQLWADIVAAGQASDDHTHFIGSIVYIQASTYQVGSLQRLLVIDGQQRLSTLLLLIRALADVAAMRELSGELAPSKLINYYLINPEETGEAHYRLLLGPADRQVLCHVLGGVPRPDRSASRIDLNYQYFRSQIEACQLPLEVIYTGLARLTAVDISLDHGRDDPQRIFESLNSTGLALTQADLIRNFVLMKLPPHEHEEVYQRYWQPMDDAFRTASAGRFDRFMRDFLTIETDSMPALNSVYEAFKTYATARAADGLTSLLDDLHVAANHYARLCLGQEPDLDLRRRFEHIRALRTDIIYLLLLPIYADYEAALISKAEFISILKMLESFILRRSVCAIPVNTLDNLFATVAKEIVPERYVESLQAAFLRRTDKRRFPSDLEFTAALRSYDCYNSRNGLFVLDRLENHGKKEYADPRNYTIEHIMPQNPNLSTEWQEALGPDWQRIQRTYLHTLGNITLTGYNPELSDLPFVEKQRRPGGFQHSPLFLNEGLGALESWDEEAILARGERLANRALSIWTRPILDDETIARYTPPEPPKAVYTFESYAGMDGPIGTVVRELDARLLSHFVGLRREPLKQYIAYKLQTNVVDVQVQKKSAKLSLNMPFDVIDDPLGLCRDVRNIGRNGNGEIQIQIRSAAQLDDVMDLIQQSYDYHLRNT